MTITMVVLLGASSALAQQAAQGAVSPEQSLAVQTLQKQVPIYVSERPGPWEKEVGGPLREGAQEWGLQGGYGMSFKMGGTKHSYNHAWILPRWGYVWTDLIGDDVLGGILQGNGEVIIEGVFGVGTSGMSGWTEGLAVMYKHNFITGTRCVPFVELGNGVSMNQWGIYECNSDFEFISQVGLGVQYFFNDNWNWMLGARYHHMSNAGMTKSNPGLNNVIFTTGVTRFF
ncbi:MAG: acyloxyacyl hydrolase [Verrucomicrobiae bacterium]|nr:acyloxyacyl hydrolase [Verrucomicrobiae bacterium]